MNNWWFDSSTWCKEPIRVILGQPDPSFCRYMDSGLNRNILRCVSSLFPENRPKNILESSYAEAIRQGFWTGANDEKVCLARCQNTVEMIDEIISKRLDAKGITGKHFDRFNKGQGPHWWGPIGFVINSEGNLAGLDGHHRTAICWLIGMLFPAHIFAVHPNSPGKSWT